MPPKQALPKKNVKKRRTIDLQTKMKIIQDHKKKKSVMNLAKEYSMSHSTIATILKNQEKYEAAWRALTCPKSAKLKENEGQPIAEMEKQLMAWVTEQTQKWVPLSHVSIRTKAKSLYDISKKGSQDDQFVASSGWFKRFLKRYSQHIERAQHSQNQHDLEAAETTIKDLGDLIEKDSYSPEQVFNIEMISIFWKHMPGKSLRRELANNLPALIDLKERVTILLGGNVAGHKLKPFVIGNSENPRAFDEIDRDELPVYYRSYKKAWKPKQLLQDALINCYTSEIREYCSRENVPFKVLLILNNIPGGLEFDCDRNFRNFKVKFLPSNTASLIQPINQGVIPAFKAHYWSRTLAQAKKEKKALEKARKKLENGDLSDMVSKIWREFEIDKCVKNVAGAWEDVSEMCMISVWKKLLRNFKFDGVRENYSVDEEIAKISKVVGDLVRDNDLGISEEEINELLIGDLRKETVQKVKMEISEDEAQIEMDEESGEDQNFDGLVDEREDNFTVQGLKDAFGDIQRGLNKLREMDSSEERFEMVKDHVHKALLVYERIFDEQRTDDED